MTSVNAMAIKILSSAYAEFKIHDNRDIYALAEMGCGVYYTKFAICSPLQWPL